MGNTSLAKTKANEFIAQLNDARKKLLDLTMRNSLLNFRHSDRSCNQLRVVNVHTNVLYVSLLQGKNIPIIGLPSLPTEPRDETTTKFQNAFNIALISDEEYLKGKENLEKDNNYSEEAEEQLIRKLKDRIREQLNLPPRTKEEISKREWAKQNNINPDYENELTDENKIYKNIQIQTLLYPKELKSKINNLRRVIKADREEKGTNTFFIALGFLEWTEAYNSNIKHHAPLLLLRLEDIQQSNKKNDFYIKSAEETAFINLSLREKLKEFNLTLPDFEEEDTPESYMDKIRKLIKEYPQWKVKNFITVGRFIFSRLAMYEDLNQENWLKKINDYQCGDNLLSALFNGTASQNHKGLDVYDIDYDKKIASFAPLVVSSTDSSQHSAIVDALKGDNLVIKGPPGTGKSQTITNLIANALYAGKKVLFMCEKKAALDVVFSRLKSIGIDDYCFELHSDKTNISTIRNGLEKSYKRYGEAYYANKNKPYLYKNDNKLIEQKRKIREYYNILQEKAGKTDKTLYDVIWAAKSFASSVSGYPAIFKNFSLKKTTSKNLASLEEDIEKIKYFEDLHKQHLDNNDKINLLQYLNLINVPYNAINDIFPQLDIIVEEIDNALNKQIYENIKLGINNNFFDAKKLFEFIEEINNQIQHNNVRQDIVPNFTSKDKLIKTQQYLEKIIKFKNTKSNLEQIYFSPISLIPQVTTIKDYISVLDNDLSLDDKTYNEICSILKNIQEKHHYLTNNLSKLITLNELIYNNATMSSKTLAAFMELFEYIETIDNLLPVYISENSIKIETNKLFYTKIKEEIDIIIDEQRKLEEFFDFNLVDFNEETEQVVKKAIKEFTTSNIFSFMKADYREAKQFYLSIAKSRKYKKEQKILQLKQLLKCICNIRHLVEEPKYKVALGQLNNGISTDIKNIISVNDFYIFLNTLEGKYGKDIALPITDFFSSETNLDKICKFSNIAKEIKPNKFFGNYSKAPLSIENYIEHLNITINRLENYINYFETLFSNKDVSLSLQKEKIEELECLSNLYKEITSDDEINNILGKYFQSIDTDVDNLKDTLSFVEFAYSEENIIATNVLFAIIKNNSFNILYRNNTEKYNQIQSIFNQCINSLKTLNFDYLKFFNTENIEMITFDCFLQLLNKIKGSKGYVYDEATYYNYLNSIKDADFFTFISYMLENNLKIDNLKDIYQYLYYNNFANSYVSKHLIGFTPNEYSSLASNIRTIDGEAYELNKEKLINRLNKIEVPIGIYSNKVSEKTDLQLILHQISGHARSIPLRKFMQKAGSAIQALKPCFLMSPISVAQYIPPQTVSFDMIIIDEASQMYFEEAVGGILRAKQLVVVGDEKQLPPTPFFQKSLVQEDDFDEDESEIDNNALSILETCMVRGFNTRELLWHYRSKDVSLIAFSNKNFYHNNLKLFPSPIISSDIQGIQRIYVNGLYKARQNEKEADEIILAIKEFVRKYPNRSLGIATMNTSQRTLIEQKVDLLATTDIHVANYLEYWDNKLESFFIKNLENVQGDERDYIFISTVYGPETTGGKVLQRFGPINGKNGYRRLNVLFTRAKFGLKLFTSLKSDDIVLSDSCSQGVRIFHDYLLYAETGRLENGTNTGKSTDSYFEDMVLRILENNGYEVDCQIGVKGFFIDLAVKHPKKKSYYMVGIECDGAPYHSTKSARDRDCIRQSVLESLGWTIYRIWSKDWFYNTEKELATLLNFLKQKSEETPDIEIYKTTEPIVLVQSDVIDKDITTSTNNRANNQLSLFENQSNNLIVNEEKNFENIALEVSKFKTDVNSVQLEDTVIYKNTETGKENTIKITSATTDFNKGIVNLNTPLAKALLGSIEDDEVEVNGSTLLVLKIIKEK